MTLITKILLTALGLVGYSILLLLLMTYCVGSLILLVAGTVIASIIATLAINQIWDLKK